MVCNLPFGALLLTVGVKTHLGRASFSHCDCVFESNYWR